MKKKPNVQIYSDLKTISDVAFQFAGTAEILDEHEGAFYRTLAGQEDSLSLEKFYSVNIAHVVTLTFAIEMYLKALCVKQKKEYIQTHDLRTLFDDLNSATRKQIIDDTKRHQSDFDTRLDVMRDAFIKFRYIHESHADNYPVGFAADLLYAVKTQLGE